MKADELDAVQAGFPVPKARFELSPKPIPEGAVVNSDGRLEPVPATMKPYKPRNTESTVS